MPQKTIQDLDAYIKATAVVYDHSNTKLVSRKTKVSRRRKEAFLSVLPYRKPSSHYHSHERKKLSSWNTRKPRSKPATESNAKDVKQKLQVFVRTPASHRHKTLYFELHPETSVSSLKEVIQKKIGVEARYQRLYIREIFRLSDLLTLEENGVDKNEIISLELPIDDPNDDDVPKDKATIDEAYLKDLSSKIESSWKELAKHLGYEEAEIADIQTTNKGSTEDSRRMLLIWWEKTTDRDEAAQKLRRALEAIGLTDLAQNVPVTSKSRDKAAGPKPERRQDAGVDEESKQNGAASTEEEELKNDEVPKGKPAIDDEYLKVLSPKIESSWKEVAKHLGYEEAEIADIQTTNKGSAEESRHMLLTWWEKTTDREEAAQKLRRALEAIGLTENVPVTSESSDKAAGPKPERQQDAEVEEESKQNGVSSTEEEKLKKEQVSDQDKPQLVSFRYVQVFIRSHLSHKPTTLCLQMDPETRISTLKQIISETISVHPQQQRLYIRRNFRNFELHNLLTLHDCGIHPDENISLRLCTDGLLGGGLEDKNTVDDQLFRDLASKTESCWEKLAKFLGYKEAEIRQFKTTFKENKEWSLQMLLSWWRNQTNRREGFQSLRDALHSIGRAKLALMIPSEEQQRMKQEEVGHRDTPGPSVQAGGAKEQGIEKGTTPSERQGPRQQEAACRDKPKLQVQVRGSKEQGKKNVTTSTERQRPRQEEVAHRDKPKPAIQMGRDKKQGKAKVTTSSGRQGPRREEIAHQGKLRPPVQVGVTETDCISDTLPDDRSIWNHSKRIGTHWEELALNLDLSKEDINIIKANHSNDVVRQCFEMLSTWWRKQDNYTEAWRTLEKALIDSGRNDLVRGASAELKGAQSSPSDVAANQCRSELKTLYTTTGSYVQLIPWVDDDMKHIRDIYTELQLEKDDQYDIKGHVGEYRDIFLVKSKDGNVIRRAILCGSAGMGKSTIIDKMAYDWATGVALGEFPLLFVLKMSALKQTSDLVDSVFDQLLSDDTKVNKRDLEAFIRDNGSSVLILIDGFDEFGTTNLEPEKFGSVLRMLNRKFGKECFVVVTTRTSHFAKLASKSLISKPFTHVKVLGLRKEDIGQYVKRFFSDKLDTAEGLLDRIQSLDVLSDLSKSPMFLLLMCLLWREKSKLPETLSRLFSQAIRYIFRRKMPKISEEAISKVLIAIGKTALKGLVSPEQRLSFQEGEFEKSALDKAIQAGILTSQRVMNWLDTHNNVQFIHKTLQEYCAAMYCQNHLGKDDGEFQEILDKMSNDPRNFEYILRFCSGDNQQCTRRILQNMHENPHHGEVGKLAVHCYFECQPSDLISVDFIESFFTESMRIDNYSNDSMNSLAWLLQHVAEQTELSGVDYLAEVHEVIFTGCDLSRLSDVVLSRLNKMNNLRVLHFNNCSLNGGNHLERLFLPKVAGQKDWAVKLRGMKSLTTLRLHGCSLIPRDVIDIASSVREMPNLADLNLSGNYLNNWNAGTWVWAASLQSMIHVKKLDLSDCCIYGHGVNSIVQSVSRMGNLVDCDFSSGSAGEWRVKSMGKGIQLSITRLSQTGEHMADILQSFSYRRDLVSLILDGDHGLGGSAGVWTPPLQNMTELQHLDLGQCALQSTDIEHIAATVSQMPNLAVLILSYNKDLGSKAETWAVSLQRMIHLEKLYMTQCSIISRDVKHIAESVSRMRNLVECSLGLFWTYHVQPCDNGIGLSITGSSLTGKDMSVILQSLSNRKDLISLIIHGIDGLGGSADIWTPPLQDLTELRQLDLSNCSMQSTDTEHLAAALSQMPNLADLNLSCNTDLGGNAETWATSLQSMIHLKKLDMSHCSNKIRDVKYIAESVSRMGNLVDCDFYSCENCFQVRKWRNGIQLRIEGRSLTGKDIADILQSLSYRRDLASLILYGLKGLGGSAGIWTLPLKTLTKLRKLDLSRYPWISADIEHLAAALSQMPTLTDLTLSQIWHSDDNTVKWAASLQRMIHLKKLQMRHCNIHIRDVKRIGESISRMGNLVECEFGHYPEVIHVRKLGNGIQLSLERSSLTSEDVAHILQSFSNRRDLVSLILTDIRSLGGSARIWTPPLRNLIELQELDLSDFSHSSLQSTDIEHLTAAVSQIPNFAYLNLSWNSKLGGNARTWAASLQTMTHLKSLDLSACHIGEQDLPHIASSVRSMPSLAELNLSWNDGLGGNAGTWTTSLQSMIHLKSLKLSMGIHKQDISCIASSVRAMQNLAELNLTWNKRLGGNAKKWAASLQSMIHLKSLNLSFCGINERDLPHIASSVGEMPNLASLNLSGSEGLKCKAGTWAASLQSMIHLKRLQMSICELNNQDAIYVAESVSRMGNLVDCDFRCFNGFSIQPSGSGVRVVLTVYWESGEAMQDMLQAFSYRRDLLSLQICDIYDEDDGDPFLDKWIPPLQNMKKLRELQCPVVSRCIEHLAAALHHMPNLADLNLRHSRNLGGNAAQWAASLQTMIHLKSLALSSCGINEQDIPHIALSVGEMPSLAELNLSGNEGLGGNAGTWAASLQRMIHLKKVSMRDCNIYYRDVKCIAESVSQMGNLVECDFGSSAEKCRVQPCDNGIQLSMEGLTLTGKDMAKILLSFSNRRDLVSLIFRRIGGLGGSTEIWTAPLQNITELRELDLINCSLQSTDIEHLAAGVSRILTVESLSLVGNYLLGGCAKIWAPGLKQMKHVSSLKLGGCALTEEDKKHLSEALGSEVNIKSDEDWESDSFEDG